MLEPTTSFRANRMNFQLACCFISTFTPQNNAHARVGGTYSFIAVSIMIPTKVQPEAAPSNNRKSLPPLSLLAEEQLPPTTSQAAAAAQQHPGGLLPILPASSVRSLPLFPAPARKSQIRPSKRQKISLACHECRQRKTKCDGARPICGSCAKENLPPESCHYEPERGKRGIKSQYVYYI